MSQPTSLSLGMWLKMATHRSAKHGYVVLTADPKMREEALRRVSAAIPWYFLDPKRFARILKRLGKDEAAAYASQKLSKIKTARSGDLGEVLATGYVEEMTPYEMGIFRLRWSDHRDMAMRGEDILAFRIEDDALYILKGESKSEAALTKRTVEAARMGLEKERGLPSPHAISFVADRLHEIGETALADVIDDALLREGIAQENVAHMLFTLSGNDPTKFHKDDLESYVGTQKQISVGIRITDHQAFIAAAFDRVSDG